MPRRLPLLPWRDFLRKAPLMNLRYAGMWAQATGGPLGGTRTPTGDYVVIFQGGLLGPWIIVVTAPYALRGVWSMQSSFIGPVKAAFKTGGIRYWTRLVSPPGWAAEQWGLGVWRDDLAGAAYWRALQAVRARGYTVA